MALDAVRVESVGKVRYEVVLPKMAYKPKSERNMDDYNGTDVREYACWLKQGLWLKEWLFIDSAEVDDFIDEIVDGTGISRRKHYATTVMDAVRGLLANLYLAYINEKPVKIPRMKGFNHSAKTRYSPYTEHRLRRIIKYLTDAGYAIYARGFIVNEGTSERRAEGPKLWLTPKGYERILRCDVEFTVESRRQGLRLARLYNERGELVDLDDPSVPESIREVLRADESFLKTLNAWLDKATLTIECKEVYTAPFAKRLQELERQLYIKKMDVKDGVKYLILKRPITRVYARGQIIMGGRFYNGSHLALPSSVRAHIKMDGEDTVELDFCSLHLSMLYHKENLPLPSNPYIYPDGDYRRSLMKIVGLVAINARSRRQALSYIRHHLEELGMDGFSAKALLDEFMAHNKGVEKYICSDIGVRLQKKDSDIMKDILSELMSLGIIALPVHDSVIVKAKYEHIAYSIMQKCYIKHMGAKINISKK